MWRRDVHLVFLGVLIVIAKFTFPTYCSNHQSIWGVPITLRPSVIMKAKPACKPSLDIYHTGKMLFWNYWNFGIFGTMWDLWNLFWLIKGSSGLNDLELFLFGLVNHILSSSHVCLFAEMYVLEWEFILYQCLLNFFSFLQIISLLKKNPQSVTLSLSGTKFLKK